MFGMINIVSGSHPFASFITPTLTRTSYIPLKADHGPGADSKITPGRCPIMLHV